MLSLVVLSRKSFDVDPQAIQAKHLSHYPTPGEFDGTGSALASDSLMSSPILVESRVRCEVVS
jgi:hypothetical protein